MTMADRIVVLKDGRVEQVGSPLELYQNPATLFVAGFIGAPKMNFLNAEIKAVNGQHLTLLLPNGASVDVPPPALKLGAGERVNMGVRPEHVTLLVEPAGGDGLSDGVLEGEVEALEHLGPRAYIHARLADGTRLVTQTGSDPKVMMGDHAAFRVRADAVHLFDASGKALARAKG